MFSLFLHLFVDFYYWRDFLALRPKKFISDKPQNRNPKKQKKQKVKFEKSKNSLNFTNVKIKK